MKNPLTDADGNKFEFEIQVENSKRAYGVLTPLNPMPELEVGDWYRTVVDIYNFCGSIYDHLMITKGEITEIRKADGRVWRRE